MSFFITWSFGGNTRLWFLLNWHILCNKEHVVKEVNVTQLCGVSVTHQHCLEVVLTTAFSHSGPDEHIVSLV